jgi:hypothetical protein
MAAKTNKTGKAKKTVPRVFVEFPIKNGEGKGYVWVKDSVTTALGLKVGIQTFPDKISKTGPRMKQGSIGSGSMRIYKGGKWYSVPVPPGATLVDQMKFARDKAKGEMFISPDGKKYQVKTSTGSK